MKILIVLPAYYNYAIGGYHVHYEYANQLTARGHAVTLVFPRSLEKHPNRLRARAWALRTRLANRPLIRSYNLHPEIRTLLVPDLTEPSLPDADILIATAWQTAAALGNAAPRHGRRFYIVYDYEYWMTAVGDEREKIAATFRAGYSIVATSRAVAAMVRSCGGDIAAEIPCGLDFGTFGLDRPPQDRTQLTLGFAARPEPFKGFPDAVSTACLLRERYGEAIQVTCFGSRTMDIPAWINALHRPTTAELRHFYNDQAVFLSTSHFEGWGLTGVEAMACGAALVTTSNGGHLDYAMQGETALVVPLRDVDAMYHAVVELFEDKALRFRIASNGRSFVQRFTWDDAADRLEALITS